MNRVYPAVNRNRRSAVLPYWLVVAYHRGLSSTRNLRRLPCQESVQRSILWAWYRTAV